MSRRFTPLPVLRGDQSRASSPADHAALSASAGTGKTHVLVARVLRLLLAEVDPSAILCLTFTKAAAAEMAERVNARLAHWVRLEDKVLRKELHALGEPNDPERVARARTLFASVLDAPGGGLRVQTIHAFAQSLLAAFPSEAGLAPGFRPLDEREQRQLARAALAGLLVRAEAEGDLGLVADMQALSLRLGEGDAEAFLAQCGRAPDALAALGPREGVEARLRHLFGLPLGDIEAAIERECGDDAFDIPGLRAIAAHNLGWSARSGQQRASVCEAWLAASPAERAATLAGLHEVWATKAGEPRAFGSGSAPQAEGYAALAMAAFDCCGRLLAMRRTAALVADLAAGLRAGQAFARAYGEAKVAAGAADFDDLIRWAERLLLTPGMGEWVRYKLDQGTDHILVDEAQDTNEAQWNIVRALSAEFFAGKGAPHRRRTIFTVGDYKQAIFGFQGTNPESFEVARAWFQREANAIDRDFLDLSMDRSFRSAPPILALVDGVIDALGHEAFGLPRRPNPHESHHDTRPGSVTLWQPYAQETAASEEDEGEEGWIPDAVRAYATQLARQVKAWLDAPFHLECEKRPLQPRDIMILVRRRSTLAGLIVARLHAEGVPVAGVDRLLLTAPLAVQDLLAAVRFAVQPDDDLTLASLLVSPLLGWTQEQLYAVAFGREGALWPAVREKGGETAEALGALLAMADYATPHDFLETILSGQLDGRRRLLARLGPEARDPIEELLSSAIEFEASGPPLLQRFLDWFARGEVEIVRDPSGPLDAVRVMTAHGSKGLQSPVVILADACVDPDRQRSRLAGLRIDDTHVVPIFRPRAAELAEPLAGELAAREARDRQEHWRLLYVALTRAEERLYVGGALGTADRGAAPANSWHAAVATALAALGGQAVADPLWTSATRFGQPELRRGRPAPTAAALAPAVPDWLSRAAPVEARPPRPLAPSAPAEDESANPPPTPAMRAAAERGRLLHRLFERLPDVPRPERNVRADAWLAGAAGVTDAAQRHALIADACRVIDDPALAPLFAPEALAEAPIAAVTADGAVVSGTVDRLLVEAERVRLVDFKTGRSLPASAADIPAGHLRQIAAYVAALEVVFPGRAIEASLLYTAGPTRFTFAATELTAWRPAVAAAA